MVCPSHNAYPIFNVKAHFIASGCHIELVSEMPQINTLEIPDELYIQIQGMARSQSRSINEQIVTLLQRALAAEIQRQTQSRVLQEIHQARWIPPQAVPGSVTILREIRGCE